MAEAERPGSESGDRTSGLERRLVDLGAVKRLQPIAGRVSKRNQRANPPGVCKRPWLGGDRDARALQPGGERVQRRSVGDLPAEEARAFAHGAVDDDALLAVVHPERELRVAAFDRLQADQAGPELPPIVEMVGSEPGISQCLQHGGLLVSGVASPILGLNPTHILWHARGCPDACERIGPGSHLRDKAGGRSARIRAASPAQARAARPVAPACP